MKHLFILLVLILDYFGNNFQNLSTITDEMAIGSSSIDNQEVESNNSLDDFIPYSKIKQLSMERTNRNTYNLNRYSYNDLYLETYYKNLHFYMPYNIKGSCGYVALAMLLSYYDSYWNDETIYYENFDSYTSISDFYEFANGFYESPGVIYKWVSDTTIGDTNSSIPTGEIIDTGNDIYDSNYIYYYNLVHHSTNDFHAYLLSSYGEPLDFIDLYQSSAFSLSSLEMKTLINEYLECEWLTSVYDFVYYDRSSKTSNQLRELIISYIQAGYPVAVGLNLTYSEEPNFTNSMTGSHALIAYKYEDNVIYGHNGYIGACNSNINIENFAQYTDFPSIERYHMLNEYLSMYVLIPKAGTHICSNNYIINGEVYCPCEF